MAPKLALWSAPVALCAAALGASAEPSSARTFGTDPIPISVGPGGQAANGPSGGAAFSGDDRKARIVAYHSEASNLVAGDRNQASDVFI